MFDERVQERDPFELLKKQVTGYIEQRNARLAHYRQERDEIERSIEVTKAEISAFQQVHRDMDPSKQSTSKVFIQDRPAAANPHVVCPETQHVR